MARKQNRRVNSRSERIVEQYVVDGNTIRKIQAIPQEEPERKPVRRSTSRNRARTRAMSRGYVMFLAVVSAAALFMCVRYLQRELLEELLPRLDHQEQDGVSVVYELYQYAVRESFSVMELQGVLERRMLEQRKSLRRESQMYGEKENSFPSENGYANTEEAGRSYLAGERKSIQEESVRSWEKEKRAGKSAGGREEEQFRTDRRNHERALEDFFSVEEEENETDRERNLPVGLLAGICAGLLYGLTGYAVWEYFPGYLGIWGAIGVIAALSFLIWQVTVKRRKKEDTQIAEQFAMYQEPAGKSLDFPKQAVGEWEEKEEEAEEVSSWENRKRF